MSLILYGGTVAVDKSYVVGVQGCPSMVRQWNCRVLRASVWATWRVDIDTFLSFFWAGLFSNNVLRW